LDLLTARIKPVYFKYLVAASSSTMVASVFGMVDAIAVGRYHGPAGSAALAVFNPVWSLVYSFGFLAGTGGAVLFATHRGKGDEKSAQQYFTLSMFYGLALSALAVAVIGLFNEPLFRLFGADDELLVLVQQYLKPVLFSLPCSLFTGILSAYLRNDGNPTLPTKAVIIGGIFNVIGDYLCVFVLDMGIFGAGLATAMGQFISVGVMLLHFAGKKNTLRIVKISQMGRKLGNITVTGFSTAINDLAMGVIGVLFNRQIMKYLNSDALAVYGVITQVTVFVQCLAYGAGQAAQPIISQNYGAGQNDRIKQCLKYGLYTSAVMGLCWTGAMLLVPKLFVNFFMTPTASVLKIAPGILRAYGISYILLPFNIFATYFFQAIVKSNISMVVSVARGVVISGGMILLMPMIAGSDSIWYAMLITEILVAAYGAWYMVKYTRKL